MIKKSSYIEKTKRRTIVFASITGAFLLFTAAYTITSLFTTIPWSDNGFVYAYCVYAIWFNVSLCYGYWKDSVKFEKENTTRYELFELAGLKPFDHKKGRREVLFLTLLVVVVNLALMIATRWLW